MTSIGRFQTCLYPIQPRQSFLLRRGAAWPRRQVAPARRCCQPTAAALPPQSLPNILTTASNVGVALTRGASALQACLDPAVLFATVGASFKLFLVCAAVGWLLRHNKIPGTTATVLSQVSFYLFIPTMLFSKVASTLSAQPSGPLLLTIVAVTLGQICLGAFFGRALAPLVDGQYSRDRQILGWHPMNPARSAAAIAASVGNATGVPLAGPALLPRTKAPPEGTRQLVALAAAFGNSFTLPAVFFMTLLPPALADRALGYAAVFMLAWSPALWSLGYSMVMGAPGGTSPQQPLPLTSPAAAAAAGGSSIGGGGSGSSIGGGGSGSGSSIGGGGGGGGGGSSSPGAELSPWQQQQQLGRPGAGAGGKAGADVKPGGLRRITSGPDWELVEGMDAVQPISFPPSEGSSSGGGGGCGDEQPTPPHHRHPAAVDRLMQYQLLRALRQFAAQVLNPPVLGILAGMAAGLTPWGRALLGSMRGAGAGSAGALGGLPPELGLLHGILRSALEVIELLAGGTLAVQTLVLAASLLKKDSSASGDAHVGEVAALPKASAGGGLRAWVRAAKRALLPADGVEERALAVLSLTRFVLVPLGTLGMLWALHAAGLLRAVGDPVLLFVLLVESVMPSAQNLIIILQLSERTQKTAPSFAALLLKLYAYSIVPVTLWVTAFATRLAIPVLR